MRLIRRARPASGALSHGRWAHEPNRAAQLMPVRGLLLLALPPFGALGYARRLGCAEVTRERVRIARGRSCLNTTPPMNEILEEECAVKKLVWCPESPERAPQEPALNL